MDEFRKSAGTLLIAGLLGVTSGCATLKDVFYHPIDIPLENELRRIEDEPYLLDVNDCKHKSLEYQTKLKEAGINAWCELGDFDYQSDHVVVKFVSKETGLVHLIDPTDPWNEDGWEASLNSDFHTWIKYNQDATIKDLETGNNFEKRYPEAWGKYEEMQKDKKDYGSSSEGKIPPMRPF